MTVEVPRFAAAAAGAITLYVGFTNWGRGQVYLYREIAAMDLVTYVLAFALLALALVQAPRWMRWVGPLILATVLFTTFTSTYVWIHHLHRTYGTDVIAFQHYAAKLVLNGTDPYTVSMLPALEEFRVPLHFNTPTLDGQIMDRVSWPAGSFLLFTPFVALGVPDLRWIALLFHLAVIGVLYKAAPQHTRPLVLLPMFVAQELVDFTGGGVVDFPWVLPILLMMIWQRRPILAGVCYGVASSIKQQPWLLAPFLLIYYLREVSDITVQQRLGRVAQFGVSAVAVFLAFNGPFIIHDARNWALGTFTPIVGNLIPFGQGLSILTQIGLPLPTEYYAIVSAGVALLLVVNYAVYFERLRDAVWLFPAIITWFAPRSLHNYFVFWIPVVALALALREVNAQRESSPVRREDTMTGPIRRRVARVSLGLAALLLLVPGAYLYGRQPGLPLRIDLVAMEDPLRVGAVTKMVVKLTNTGFTEIKPVISIFSSIPFPVIWPVASGPDRLSPRSIGVYVIEADVLEKAILPGQDIVVRVNHARGRLFATSRPFRTALKQRVLIANTTFTHWILDTATSRQKPFGWEVAPIGGRIGDDLNVARATVGGRQALAFQIHHRGKVPGWRGVHVRQRIEDPQAIARLFAGALSVWVYPTYDYAINPAGWPLNVFGIEINDGDRLLWVVFSGKGAGRSALPNHTIVVLHAPLGQWSRHRIDLQALYRSVGWSRPERMTFMLLAATTHERPGTFAPAFGEITQGPAQGVRSSR